MVMKPPPIGPFVTSIHQQKNADHRNICTCDNSDAIYDDMASMSHISLHLYNIVYLQDNCRLDTAVAVMWTIYTSFMRILLHWWLNNFM